MTFVAVAGRSSPAASRAVAPSLFDPDRIFWGYDDGLWQRYGVRGQPVTFVIDDGAIVEQWFGGRPEADIRALLEGIVTS
ncbi:MAG: hypothetical protein R3290_09010 [Acidimicrobiia bacterium]|nr:hypothetical protein [Acidimicrobiia bacterium]